LGRGSLRAPRLFVPVLCRSPAARVVDTTDRGRRSPTAGPLRRGPFVTCAVTPKGASGEKEAKEGGDPRASGAPSRRARAGKEFGGWLTVRMTIQCHRGGQAHPRATPSPRARGDPGEESAGPPQRGECTETFSRRRRLGCPVRERRDALAQRRRVTERVAHDRDACFTQDYAPLAGSADDAHEPTRHDWAGHLS
jgi:hypothetical protein